MFMLVPLSVCETCSSTSRPAGGAEVNHEGYGATPADWPAALFRHRHVRYHRRGVLHGQVPPYLLQVRHKYGSALPSALPQIVHTCMTSEGSGFKIHHNPMILVYG